MESGLTPPAPGGPPAAADRGDDDLRALSMRLVAMRRPGTVTRFLQRHGAFDRRNMVWSWTDGEPRNFGDWIGPLIFLRRQACTPLLARLKEGGARHAFLAAGSIMGRIQRPDAATVWGAGIMRRDQRFLAPREIRAVRGPLTRGRCRELGHDCPDIYGDPAILLPLLFPPHPREPSVPLGIVPHFVHLAEARRLFGAVEGVRVVDVTQPVSDVVAAIRSCGATVSSSLHGLIVSHAYGIPSAWISFGAPLRGDGVKYHDYYLAAGIEPPAVTRVTAGAAKGDLIALSRGSPRPDLHSLQERLADACPF
jgi:hypothetical protein